MDKGVNVISDVNRSVPHQKTKMKIGRSIMGQNLTQCFKVRLQTELFVVRDTVDSDLD